MKENVDINIPMNRLSIDDHSTKKMTTDGAKQNGKVKYADKKKFKNLNVKNERSCSGSIVNMARKGPTNINNSNVVKSRQQNYRQTDVKHGKDIKSNNRTPSKFHIHINQADMEICRQTAIRLNDVRQSIAVDPLLANHLCHLAFVSNQHLFEQQRNMFIFHEEQKRVEISKWLSTKTEAERVEYANRVRAEHETTTFNKSMTRN